jgi:DNA repair exonuclease SbcCD ATPase subunit
MILESLTIEGFRCFDRRVELPNFAPGVNILHGPNGTGKSTIVRALRHLLLDAHSTSGQAAKNEMQPWGRSLTPRLSAVFSHQNERYRAEKQFLNQPSAKLERHEGAQFRPIADGVAANQKLLEMFRATPPLKGLASIENLGLFQALWTTHAAGPLPAWSAGVREVVERSLGAAITSPATQAIGKAIDARWKEFYTPKGAPNKDWKTQEAARESAHAEVERIRLNCQAAEILRARLANLRADLAAESAQADLARNTMTAAQHRSHAAAETRQRLADARTAEATTRQQYESLTKQLDDCRKAAAAARDHAAAQEALGKANAALHSAKEQSAKLASLEAEFQQVEALGNDAKEWFAGANVELTVEADAPITVENTLVQPGQAITLKTNSIHIPGVARITARPSGARDEILKRRPDWAVTPPDLESLRARYKSLRSEITSTSPAVKDAATAAQRAQAAAAANLKNAEFQTAQFANVTGSIDDLTKLHADAALAFTSAKAQREKFDEDLKAAGGDPEPARLAAAQALQSIESKLTKTRTEAAGLEGELKATTERSLYTQLVEKEEALAVTDAALARQTRRAKALDLLKRSIEQAESELAASLPAHIAGRATAIWRRIAGPTAPALAVDESWRPTGAHVPTEHLSGGEAEQVTFATRLALAQELAKDERHLAVFDDAFLSTDQSRTQAILELLQEASQHLQILILTCHPERYETLRTANYINLEAVRQIF